MSTTFGKKDQNCNEQSRCFFASSATDTGAVHVPGSAVLDGEKAALHRDEYGVSSIIGAEFRHHIFHVSLHRVFGD